MDETAVLHIYSSSWGLPSTDVDCLELLTLAQICGFHLKVVESNNPFGTPHGRLPALYFDESKKTTTEFSEVQDRLKSLKFNSDYNLSSEEIHEAFLIRKFMDSVLKPALIYTFWVDPEVHWNIIRPLYSSKIPFPLGAYYVPKYHKEALNYISAFYNVHREGLESGDSSVLTRTHFDAIECLDFLSNRLKNRPFFLGNSPSSLDASVYAYLAPLCKAPLGNNSLHTHLKNNCPKLVEFVERITDSYFSESKLKYEKEMKKKQEMQKQAEEDKLFFSNYNALVSGCFAGVVMLSFALHQGYLLN